MLEGLLAILVCLLLGTGIAAVLPFPLPGAVVGLVLMLGYLAWRRPAADSPVLRAGDRLLDILPMLFVPAGVGVITCLGLIRAHAATVLAGLVLPWAVCLLAAAGFAALAARLVGRRTPKDAPGGAS